MFVMPALGFGAWTLFKKDDKEESSDDKEETSGPQLTFDQDATKTINENENTEPSDDTDETTQVGNSTTSTYKIEYAGGGDGSNAIDLTLSWTNGTGFDEVAKLVFVRSIGDKELQTESTTDETATSNDGKGSITFKGTNLNDDVDSAIGENIVQAFAYDSEDKVIGDGKALATAKIGLSQADLDQTYTGPHGDLTIPVTFSSDTMKLDKIIKKTYYTTSHSPDIWFEIEKNGDKVKFKRKKDMYLSIGGVDTFKLQNYKGRLVITNNDKIYVPGRGMKNKTELSTRDYYLAQCDLIGASLIVEDGNVRQNVDFVAPGGQYFAIYENDGNFAVYMGSGSHDNKGILWQSGTGNKTEGQIVMRSQHNTQGKYAALSFSSTKDLAGDNIKKEMISINKGTAPYKLLISDVGRLVIIDRNGHEMIMKNGGNMYSSFYKPAFGDLCGNDLPHYQHGGGSMEIKHQTCANKCAADTNCAGFTLNDTYCFPKKVDFLTTGAHESQACINKHGKVRFSGQNRHDGNLFFYKRGECKGCPNKLSAEACANDSNCKWEGKSNECNLSAARVCGNAVGKETADAVECCRNNNCDDDCQW
tara:strand:+ start:339 stop:2105 length:1767 start_codon:yes stop_codon:yes gene_type:complete